MGKQKAGEGITWTDFTWNVLRGCARQSSACRNCYAEEIAVRFSGPGQPFEGLVHPVTKGWNGIIKLYPEKLDQPLRWTRPRLVFVNSVSDLFGATNEEIAAIFGVMALAEKHTFQTLTKRSSRMKHWFGWLHEQASAPAEKVAFCVRALQAYLPMVARGRAIPTHWPLTNVWLGVTVEDQENADLRVPHLLACEAARFWVSAEPLLGEVDFSPWIVKADWGYDRPGDQRRGLDLVIVGGESGRRARPMHPNWARLVRDACAGTRTAFHLKQLGEYMPWPDDDGPVADERGHVIPSVILRTPGKDDPVRMLRVGKRAAGRLLDGVLHDELIAAGDG